MTLVVTKITAKVITRANDWYVIDQMRGFTTSGTTNRLNANTSTVESAIGDIRPTATGFNRLVHLTLHKPTSIWQSADQ